MFCLPPGDGEYKPYISAEPDITTILNNGSEDFLIIACDGLWDTITPEEATEIVFQHLEENRNTGGDIDNIGARLATAAKDKGSGDNITIIVVFIRPVEEVIARGRDSKVGLEKPDIAGITSTSDYVFMSSRDSMEPSRDQTDFTSPNVSFGNQDGGGVMFSPDPFANIQQSPGADFNFSSEAFDNKIDDQRLSGESQDRISEEHMEELLKQQSIDKVDDLIKMLDREDCSPIPDEDDARPLEEILAVARLQPQDEVDGVVDDDDSSDDEIVDFGACDQLNNGSASGNIQLEEILKLDEKSLTEDQEETDTFSEGAGVFGFQEPRMDPCEQVTVKETGPEEYSTIVPPVQEMPSQQQPVMELVNPMVCSMVREEQEQEVNDVKTNGAINGIHHVNGNGEADSVSFDAQEDVGFMLKTPGETGEEELSEFSPGQEVEQEEEQETSVDTGESVGATASGSASLVIPNMEVTPATPVKERSPAPLERKVQGEENEGKKAKQKAEAASGGSGATTAASAKKPSSGGARPKVGVKEPAGKPVRPPVNPSPAPRSAARSTTGRPGVAAATSRPSTTSTTATAGRTGSAPSAGRSKVAEDTKSSKSGSTTGSERNSKTGIVDKATPKTTTAAARTQERKPTLPKKDEGTKKPTTARPKPEPGNSKDPKPAATRRFGSGTNKPPSNLSGQTSSASSTSSSSRSRPAVSSARPATATTRVKPEEKKTGTVPRAPASRATTTTTTTARTASSSAGSSSRLTGTSSRTSSSNLARNSSSATTSRAAKTTTPVKPSAAAERVAAARAAAMAKPGAKVSKTKPAAGSKKGEEKKTTTNEDKVSAAPVVEVEEANTNGNGAVGGENPGDVRDNTDDNDIQHTVNGLSDVNQSEC